MCARKLLFALLTSYCASQLTWPLKGLHTPPTKVFEADRLKTHMHCSVFFSVVVFISILSRVLLLTDGVNSSCLFNDSLLVADVIFWTKTEVCVCVNGSRSREKQGSSPGQAIWGLCLQLYTRDTVATKEGLLLDLAAHIVIITTLPLQAAGWG